MRTFGVTVPFCAAFSASSAAASKSVGKLDAAQRASVDTHGGGGGGGVADASGSVARGGGDAGADSRRRPAHANTAA
jgi:hypothetical protein